MRLRIQFEAELFAARPAAAVVMIEAAGPASSTIEFGPGISSEIFHDYYGNTGRRLHLPGGIVKVEYDAIVEYLPETFDGPTDADPDLMTVPAKDLIYTFRVVLSRSAYRVEIYRAVLLQCGERLRAHPSFAHYCANAISFDDFALIWLFADACSWAGSSDPVAAVLEHDRTAMIED